MQKINEDGCPNKILNLIPSQKRRERGKSRKNWRDYLNYARGSWGAAPGAEKVLGCESVLTGRYTIHPAEACEVVLHPPGW